MFNLSSGMPQIEDAFDGWFDPVSLIVITQAFDEGLVTEVESVTEFNGVIQPLSPEQIQLKPEGQRSFKWLQIHCEVGGLVLKTNDRIKEDGQKYKVMNILPYTKNGYIEYHAIEDYENTE